MGGEIVHCFCYIGIKVIAIGVCMFCPRYVDSQKFVVPPHVHRSESQRSNIFQSEQDRSDVMQCQDRNQNRDLFFFLKCVDRRVGGSVKATGVKRLRSSER